MHAVTVGDLVQGCTGFEVVKCKFGEHRFWFSWLVQLLPSPTTSPRCACKPALRLAFWKKIFNQKRHANRPPLHLFIAAPNAFTFFLGQRQPGLGKITLYEYDFEGANGGGYKPSLSLPI
ncbi:hypothetical protein AWB64_00101 [Caballeronia sordidicola]|uniref:SMODS-associated and fused to various effectors domain-containing protein n=1 Tax=Caballeronia sordidicola TaxID=196367 RepID=A0A158ENP8_CABSO|nr:SAVED domain-containing protein [Caballeronia sordidicola]SAL09202.1 hypothetical protein AWB64_00101 [Caballeronia sordidicola]